MRGKGQTSATTRDPLRQARLREVATVAVGVSAAAIAAGWALRPLPAPQHQPPDLMLPQQAPEPGHEADGFNLAAFQARIWNPRLDPVEPPVVEAKPAEKPPPPLRLQLVAIVRDGEELRAALYDPDANELRLARVGESIARHTITLVDATGVELRPPGASADPRRIDLIPPGGAR